MSSSRLALVSSALCALTLFTGCTDPVPTAVATCQALPGLAVDEAGRKLLDPLLVAADLAALDALPPTAGLQKVGSERLAELRSKTTCTAGKVESAGGEGWAVPLTRVSPKVNPDGSFGEPETTEFSWIVTEAPEGLRVKTRLEFVYTTRKSVEKAIAEKDWRRVSATWRAIAKEYPDPLLAVDVAEAEAQEARYELLAQLKGVFAEANETEVIGLVESKATVEVPKVKVRISFETAGEPIRVDLEAGPVPAGGNVQVRTPIPEGAIGQVLVEVVEVLN
ncbi:MAG: hypothetical protein RIT28_1347 [Pseudomonadota bacterium]